MKKKKTTPSDMPLLVSEAQAAAHDAYHAIIAHRHTLDSTDDIEALDLRLERALDSINIARGYLRNQRADIVAAAKRTRTKKGGKP